MGSPKNKMALQCGPKLGQKDLQNPSVNKSWNEFFPWEGGKSLGEATLYKGEKFLSRELTADDYQWKHSLWQWGVSHSVLKEHLGEKHSLPPSVMERECYGA